MHSCKEEYRIYRTSTTEAGYPGRAQTFSSVTMIPSAYVHFHDPFHLLKHPRVELKLSQRLLAFELLHLGDYSLPVITPIHSGILSHGGSVRFYTVLIHMASLLSCRATAISTTRTQEHLTVVRSVFLIYLLPLTRTLRCPISPGAGDCSVTGNV